MTANPATRAPSSHGPGVATWLVLAAIVRVVCVVSLSPYDRLAGGDGPWYVRQGWLILHGSLQEPLDTVGPLYPLLLSALWLPFPGAIEPVRADLIPSTYLTLVRLVQVGFGVLTVLAGSRLAWRLTNDTRAVRVVAIGLGLGPAFVMQPFQILTESLFMLVLAVAILLHVRVQRDPGSATMSAEAVAFGLATLVRPVVWLFPFVAAIHLVAVKGRHTGGRWAGALLGVYLMVLAPWHAYLQVATGHPVPQGLLSNFWIGAVGEGRWMGSRAMDERRRTFEGGENDYATEALAAIRGDPLRWARLRATRLAEAILQPHGTADLSGPSAKAAFATVVHGDARASAVVSLLGSGSFWLKAAIYVFHFTALVLGGAGMWRARGAWRDWYAPYAIVVYLCAVYGLLTVLPRYLFPAEMFLWVFAAAAAAGIGREARS